MSIIDSTVGKLRRWCPISQAREVEAKKPKKGSEIPIPTVRVVPTYDRDYLPLFREQNTYIRGRGKRAACIHLENVLVEWDIWRCMACAMAPHAVIHIEATNAADSYIVIIK